MSEAPLVRLRGVTRRYGQGEAEVQALRGIDLDVRAGEFVAVMGPSGSGKSTAMNILGCLDVPTDGHYEFQGVAVERLSREQRALLRRHFLGFVFQGFNLLPRTTALENVELPLVYRGEPAARRHAAARAALAQVGLSGREDHTPAELSGGDKNRSTGFACWRTRDQLRYFRYWFYWYRKKSWHWIRKRYAVYSIPLPIPGRLL